MSYEFPSIEKRAQNPDLDEACKFIERLLVMNALEKPPENTPDSHTYTSKQMTTCAGCLKEKHTPLRIDDMGGYVCLTCIDKALSRKLPVPVIPDNWAFKKVDDGILVDWPNGEALLKPIEDGKGLEAGLLYDLARDLLELDEKFQKSWFDEGEFPPVNATVFAKGSPGYDDIGVVTIRTYGNTLCIAETEDGEEVVFSYNDSTFEPLSD